MFKIIFITENKLVQSCTSKGPSLLKLSDKPNPKIFQKSVSVHMRPNSINLAQLFSGSCDVQVLHYKWCVNCKCGLELPAKS